LVADLTLTLASGIAILALFDIFLRDSQKTRLREITLRVWDRLDGIKRLSSVRWMERQKAAKWFVLAVLPVFVYYFYYWNLIMDFRSFVTAGIVMLALFGVSGAVIRILLRSESLLGLVYRAAITQLIAISPLLAALKFAYPFPSINSTTTLIELAAFAFSLTLFVLIEIVSFVIVFPLFLAYSISAMLELLEFFVRRIAGHPKAPILAISAVLGAIAVLLKSLP
jgi:hypothetical protein